MNFIAQLYVTVFFIGKSRYFPGTLGTLPAILAYLYLLNYSLEIRVYAILALIFLAHMGINFLYKKKIFVKDDAQEIVIDEFIGYLSFMIFFELNIYHIFIAFVLFRLFDIYKPYPISLIDKKMKNSFGIILDDLLAGIFSGIILYSINILYVSII